VSPLIVLLLTLAAGGQAQAVAADGAPTSPVSSQPRVPPAGASDRQDIVLLLEQGPLQLRLNLSIGGKSLAAARREYVARLISSLDKNKDGKLSRDEAQMSPLFRTKSRPSARAFLDSLRAQAVMTAADVERGVEQKVGQLVAYRDELTSSKTDVEVFKLLDADGSGVLDTHELTAAESLIAQKDEDGDDCVSFQEFFPPPPPPDPMQVLLGTEEPLARSATISQLVRSAREPSLPQRMRIRYDKNRDLELSAAELSWTAERVKRLDANSNGKLDAEELARLAEQEPDVELTVDLAASGLGGGVISVEKFHGKRLDDGGRPDYAKLSFPAAVVTFSHRNLDPVAESIADAMRKFNELDADANGYLDKAETMERIRFERGLFEMIDIDGDEKLFADEMKQYVTAFSEPAASTCKMHLYDTGYGFFMALDGNADGRVSKRERQGAAMALAALDRDGQLGVGEKEPVRHFHFGFQRDSFKLFSASEELAAEAPTFQQRKPTGPIWFQRMDRNNDGDVAWNEFLGHLETFHQLDTDGDDLLSPQEAARYKAPAGG
jgi:Ca2+-binding EF-hand superfamily protein